MLGSVAGLRDSKQELPGDFDQWINRWALETMGVLALDTRFGVLKTEQTEEAKKILAVSWRRALPSMVGKPLPPQLS